MIEKLDIILSSSDSELLNGSLVMDVMKLFSIIKYSGGQPPFCSKCLKEFITEIRNTKKEILIQKIMATQDIKQRKCVPAWDGNRFFTKAQRHYNSKLITDAEAVIGLKNGTFTKDHFKVLPDMPDFGSTTDHEPNTSEKISKRNKK